MRAYPGVALPLLGVPVLVDPVLVDPVLADPVLADPVLVDSAPAVPLPSVAVFVDPALPVPGVLSVGVLSVGPVLGAPEDDGLDVGEADVEELLPAAGDDWVTLGLLVSDGLAGGDEHCGSVALADVLPPFTLALAFAEAAELTVLVAAVVALAVAVVAVAVPVAAPVAPAPGLLLVLPLGGLLTEFSAAGLGDTDFAGVALAEAAGEAVAHPVADGAPPWAGDVPP